MTEKQTTAERIFALIFENIGYTDGDDRTVAAIAAEIDRLTAERNEAREQIAALEASNAEHAQMMADGFADAKEQSARLAEARAKIERLRLPAEAWETLEAAREAGRTGTEEDEDAARGIHKAARDAARAAKESQP